MKRYKELYLSQAEASCLWQMLGCNIILYILHMFSVYSVSIPVSINIIDDSVNVLSKNTI